MIKKSNIFFLIIFLIGIISANGLQVIGETIVMNKTVGIDKEITFNLKNTDSFSFYNISIVSSDITMPIISELTSGSTATITAIVKTNIDLNAAIKIKGEYYTDLGTSNETYPIDIDYSFGLNPCSFSIVKGDTIIWFNNAEREVKLVNALSSVEIATIVEDGNYSETFAEPTSLKYFSSWFGFQFSNDCLLSILDSTGYIHNPEFDAILDVDIDVQNEPTTITSNFLDTSYTLNFFDEEQGLFLIKNTGSYVASHNLSGDWFSFSPNNFDLSPGLSRTISYTINPVAQFTNETNKSYSKNVLIEGNFETINQTFDIFINYANIDDGNYTGSGSLIDIVAQFCLENPDVCSGDTKIIYKSANDSEVNVTVASRQLRDIFDFIYKVNRDAEEYQTYRKEIDANTTLIINAMAEKQNNMSVDMESFDERIQTSDAFGLFMIVGITLVLGLCGGGYIIYDTMKNKKLKKLRFS